MSRASEWDVHSVIGGWTVEVRGVNERPSGREDIEVRVWDCTAQRVQTRLDEVRWVRKVPGGPCLSREAAGPRIDKCAKKLIGETIADREF
jgi:hypothetical protein